jgi:multidrug efflux pump subunit AcrA (membrane-fusion protein)
VAEVRTRDEALAAIDAALGQWTQASAGAVAQAATSAGAARSEADAEVSRRAQRVSQLADALAVMRDDEPLRAVAAAALARAKESLETGQRAAGTIADVGARVAALQRSQIQNSQAFAEAARADLARRSREVGAYRAAGARAGAGGLLGEFGAVGAARPPGGLTLGGTGSLAPRGRTDGTSWLADRGFADVDVALADYSDNPIVGKFGRGGCTRADYRWAVTTWDEVIRPGLDNGMTRDDFAARDAVRAARSPRSFAEVYDMFLGENCIRIDRLPDGTLRVSGGRHRIEVARELGVTRLPAKWGG